MLYPAHVLAALQEGQPLARYHLLLHHAHAPTAARGGGVSGVEGAQGGGGLAAWQAAEAVQMVGLAGQVRLTDWQFSAITL